MIKQNTKTELLNRLNNDTQTFNEDEVWVSVAHRMKADPEDIEQEFEVTYGAVIESDWWERVQEEKRRQQWLDKQIYETDKREFELEKSRLVSRYG